ncbi:MAG: cytochrome P460 family protein [Planctomycetales bacterium]
MRKMLFAATGLTAVVVATLSFLSHVPAHAQSGSRFEPTLAPDPYEVKLWKWLQAAKYRNWAPVPGKSGDFYPGESPHGAFLKMYLNRTAAGSPKELPAGSVLIKENYTANKQLAAVTVMYKTKGYHAAAADWYWVKFNPDGSAARKGDVKLAGKVKGCIDCHGDAEGNDWAFFND